MPQVPAVLHAKARQGAQDGGPATRARIFSSSGVTVDPRNGSVYITQFQGDRVRRVDSEVRDRMVRVELDLDQAAAASPIIQHGLPGSVTVNVERVTPAILLLRAAGVMLAGSSAEAATPERAP